MNRRSGFYYWEFSILKGLAKFVILGFRNCENPRLELVANHTSHKLGLNMTNHVPIDLHIFIEILKKIETIKGWTLSQNGPLQTEYLYHLALKSKKDYQKSNSYNNSFE